MFKASLKYWIDLGLNQSNSWSLNFCMQMLLPFFIVISKIFFSFDPKKDSVPGKFCKFPIGRQGLIDYFHPQALFPFGSKGQCQEIFDFRLFHESVSLKPLSIP
jgi:hypothetical protein